MKKHIAMMAIAGLLAGEARAQDPVFLNAAQSVIYTNPSFAGSNGLLRGQTLFRSQWPGLSAPYLTQFGSVDGYLKRLRGGLAFSYLYDNQARGTLQSNSITFSYAQHITLGDRGLKIIPSVQAGLVRKDLDAGKISFGDMLDMRGSEQLNYWPLRPVSRRSYYDLGAGLLAQYQGFYFSAAAFHLNRPNVGLARDYALPVRLSLYSAYNMNIGGGGHMNISARYERQDTYYYASAQVSWTLRHVLVGVGGGPQDLNVKLGAYARYFTITAGYDAWKPFRNGDLGVGSWELAASLTLRDKENRRRGVTLEAW